MKIGLDHFKGCQHIETVIFHSCKHLEGDGLMGLVHLKNTLKDLQISECLNIADEGLKCLGELKNLQKLNIFKMDLKNQNEVLKELQQQLPKCKISMQEK